MHMHMHNTPLTKRVQFKTRRCSVLCVPATPQTPTQVSALARCLQRRSSRWSWRTWLTSPTGLLLLGLGLSKLLTRLNSSGSSSL